MPTQVQLLAEVVPSLPTAAAQRFVAAVAQKPSEPQKVALREVRLRAPGLGSWIWVYVLGCRSSGRGEHKLLGRGWGAVL